MLWTMGIVISDVEAVGALTAFHVFYLSEALAKVKSGGSIGLGSLQNGMNWNLVMSRSEYLVLFLVSLYLAVLPGPPAGKCGWYDVARGLVTATSMSKCFPSCHL